MKALIQAGRGLRPCVVVNGGREPPQWEQYQGHQFLHTIGALDCCAGGACWKSRVLPLGDGDPKDHDLCGQPVAGYPRCMWLIRPEEIVGADGKANATRRIAAAKNFAGLIEVCRRPWRPY